LLIFRRQQPQAGAQLDPLSLLENSLKPIYLASLICAATLLSFANAHSEDAGKADTQHASAEHQDFDKIDIHRHGYLTAEDLKGDDYVSKHFTSCNVKHDGHMSREEYGNCHE
jgi:hypothetical protein